MCGEPVLSFFVDSAESGERLDVVVARRIPECSRSRAGDLIRKGFIRTEEEIKKPAHRVRTGERVRVCLPPPAPVSLAPEPIELDIRFEDDYLLVVNKPAGLVVHPSPGHSAGTLVHALLYHLPDLSQGLMDEERPGIVHRLDKDTSGCLLAAKTRGVQHRLSDQFKSRSVEKTYLAVVHGIPLQESGIVALPIGRHPVDRKRMSTQARKARSAETHWRIRQRLSGAALLEIDLKTGRTHQIRVHCAAMGHPVLGDEIYGRKRNARAARDLKPDRQMLHAWRLRFRHPVTGADIQVESPLPEDMLAVISRLSG